MEQKQTLGPCQWGLYTAAGRRDPDFHALVCGAWESLLPS